MGGGVEGADVGSDLVELSGGAAVEDDVEAPSGEVAGEGEAEAAGGAGNECPGAGRWVVGWRVVVLRDGAAVEGETEQEKELGGVVCQRESAEGH